MQYDTFTIIAVNLEIKKYDMLKYCLNIAIKTISGYYGT